MTLGSSRPLTGMNTRNIPGGKGRPVRRLTISPPSVNRLSTRRFTTSQTSAATYRDRFTFVPVRMAVYAGGYV
jgi:hypothetical protein